MRNKRAKQLRRDIRDGITGVVSPHEVDKKYRLAKKEWSSRGSKQSPKLKQSKRQQRIKAL